MYYCDRYCCILYSNQTRSQIQTDQQFPSVGSQTKGLLVNADGSVDIYFPRQMLKKLIFYFLSDNS
ncbi:DUF1214 domain-containing protein [Planktothrix agardhii]|uniref:DUF1214 domain-containing protein n=1 Tax=Planktothrix agardhii TaxID=1160 RepID=UPI0034E0B4F3